VSQGYISKTPISKLENQSLKDGDIWVDTINYQLNIYAVGEWAIVGPSESPNTGAFAATLSDNTNTDTTYNAILNTVNNEVVSAVVDDEFNFFLENNHKYNLGNLPPLLKKGINLASGAILNGTASSALGLKLSVNGDTFPASNFLRKNNADGESITGKVVYVTPSNQTLALGRDGVVIRRYGNSNSNFIQFYKNANDAVILNNTPGGKIIFKVKGSTDGDLTTAMYMEKSLVKVNLTTEAVSSTTGALVVAGGVAVGGNLYVGKKLYVNGFNLNTATLSLSNTSISTSTTTGAFTVAGGVGIGGRLNVGSTATIYSTATSVSTVTGAVTVIGGVGIGGNLNVGGIIGLDSSFYLAKIASNPILAFNPNSYIAFNRSTNQYYFYNTATTSLVIDKNYVLLPNTATSISTTTGALQVAGGVGIGGNLNVGSTSSVFANSYIGENTSTTYIGGYTKWLVLDGIPKETPVGIAGIELRGGSYSGNGTQSQINFVARATNGTDANSGRIELTNSANKTNTGIMKIYTAGFSSGLVEALRIDDSQIVSVRSNEISNSTNTGALLVAGGVGIGGAVNIGKTSTISGARILTTATSTLVVPEDFGAKGDGSTNDYGALQAAINSGKSVYLSDGKTYYYTTGLVLNNSFQRFGGPGVLKPSGSINGVTIGGGSEGVEVDLTFNAPNLAGCAVRVDNANRVNIKKLHGVSVGTNNTTSSILYVQKSNTCVVEWMWALTGGKGITWYGTDDSLRSDILRINFAVLDCADDQYGLDWDGNCHSLEIGYLGLVGTKGAIIRNTYYNNSPTASHYPAIGRLNHIEIDYPTSHGIEIQAGLDYDINIPYILGAGFSISSPGKSGIKIGSIINSYQVRINGGKSIGNTGYGIENTGGVVYFDGTTDLSNNTLGRTTGPVWTTVERLTLDDDYFYLTMSSGNPLIVFGDNSYWAYDRTNKQLNLTIDAVTPLKIAKNYVQTYTPIVTPTYKVGTLPTGAQGMRAFVDDASTNTFHNVVAGGGSYMVPVYYTGSEWRIG
jgi:hypothetical protein